MYHVTNFNFYYSLLIKTAHVALQLFGIYVCNAVSFMLDNVSSATSVLFLDLSFKDHAPGVRYNNL